MSSNKSHSSKTTTTTTTTSTPESEESKLVKKLKTILPALSSISNEKEEIIELAKLVEEMSKETYTSAKKYNLAYKIIKIGNLIDVLLPSIKNEKSYFDSITSLTDLNKLKSEQQKAIFIQYRNLIADGFHAMHENSIKLTLESLINVCNKGIFDRSILTSIIALSDKLKRGSSMVTIFKIDTKLKLGKIYHQVIYFLQKTGEFIKNGEYDEAAMALVATGTCARNINTSAQNPIKSGSIMQILATVRTDIAHIYASGYNKEAVEKILKPELLKISDYVNKVSLEAAQAGIIIDEKSIANYGKKISLSIGSSESPRAYEPTVFKL